MGNNNFSRPDDCAPTGFKGYANSKLATLLAAQEWQRRFRSSESTRHDIAVAVHPGLVDTELARGWLTGADVTGGLHATQSSIVTQLYMRSALCPMMRLLIVLARPEQVELQLTYHCRSG